MHGNVLLYVMIYLAAMVVVVPLAKRLGLGAVLGYLLAGLALGPFGFGLAENTDSIKLLAELGVVLMLFTIGLELDGKRLWSMRHRVFTFGSLQVVVCGVSMMLAMLAFQLSYTASLIVGITLALSSTAVAVQLMNDRNLMGTQAGQSVFGILLFQDMAAIPLLIAIGILAPSAGSVPFKVLPALAAIVALVLFGRHVVGYLLRWIARQGSRELFVGAALLMVIAVMEGMTMVGVSSGLGAFLAGVMLASSEFKHELEADLEPFKGLFLGLFFITIGSSLDIALLRAKWPLLLGLLVAFMAAKFFLLYGLAVVQRISRRERLAFATLLGQGSEFAFVVSSLATAGGLLTALQGGTLNLVIGLSIAVSPLLMKLHDFLVARFLGKAKSDKTMDTDIDHSTVVIAGFGRYGQIIGRVLLANGISTTVLDHDSEHIESMRKFGFKVFFGDATRLDLMEVAGVQKAKVLVVAVDHRDTIDAIVDLALKHFPHLHIVARAKDVRHLFELHGKGVGDAERELFEGSLASAKSVLTELGFGRHEAFEMVNRFKQTNQELTARLEKIRVPGDDSGFIKEVRKARQELERQLEAERLRSAKNPHPDWKVAKNRERETVS
jgi:glutathione-regulated potassium-efflux system ancillary protein KefC